MPRAAASTLHDRVFRGLDSWRFDDLAFHTQVSDPWPSATSGADAGAVAACARRVHMSIHIVAVAFSSARARQPDSGLDCSCARPPRARRTDHF